MSACADLNRKRLRVERRHGCDLNPAAYRGTPPSHTRQFAVI